MLMVKGVSLFSTVLEVIPGHPITFALYSLHLLPGHQPPLFYMQCILFHPCPSSLLVLMHVLVAVHWQAPQGDPLPVHLLAWPRSAPPPLITGQICSGSEEGAQQEPSTHGGTLQVRGCSPSRWMECIVGWPCYCNTLYKCALCVHKAYWYATAESASFWNASNCKVHSQGYILVHI